MEFDFDINQIIPYIVTRYDGNLKILHPKNLPEDQWQKQLDWGQRKNLGYVMDRMGEASSRAQGLREIITSTQRLQISELHRVYLMKDPQGNNGRGSVVGLLKVGEKNLFVYDAQGKNHEMKPTCVLDFYINEKVQRRGYGKCVFDFMLENEGISAVHMAIDKPSEKSVRFLRKHYSLKNPISQVNNFVVFDGFFRDRPNNNVFVRNKRSLHRIDSMEGRKFSAEPSYNRQPEQLGLEFKTVLNRTGSVDSRYYNRADNLATATLLNNRQTGYTPDFSKDKQQLQQQSLNNSNNQFKHLNNNQQPEFQDSYGISNLNLDSMFKTSARKEQAPQTFDSAFKTNLRSESSNSQHNISLNQQQSNRSAQNFSPSPGMNQQQYSIKSSPNLNQISNQLNVSNFNSVSQYYQPFPSIHNNVIPTAPNYNDVNRITSKPPLPMSSIPSSYHTANKMPSNQLQFHQQPSFAAPQTALPHSMAMNRYEPFPSLNVIKTVPEFYGAQSGNYRKTRLW